MYCSVCRLWRHANEATVEHLVFMGDGVRRGSDSKQHTDVVVHVMYGQIRHIASLPGSYPDLRQTTIAKACVGRNHDTYRRLLALILAIPPHVR